MSTTETKSCGLDQETFDAIMAVHRNLIVEEQAENAAELARIHERAWARREPGATIAPASEDPARHFACMCRRDELTRELRELDIMGAVVAACPDILAATAARREA